MEYDKLLLRKPPQQFAKSSCYLRDPLTFEMRYYASIRILTGGYYCRAGVNRSPIHIVGINWICLTGYG
jgi:hypothetical protein